jgi:hypothetical protein
MSLILGAFQEKAHVVLSFAVKLTFPLHFL